MIMGLALGMPVAHAQLAPPVDAIDVNLVGIGIGMTMANDKFMQTYYGIYGRDIALFPTQRD